MGTQSFRLQRDDRVGESTQVLDQRINKIVRERLLPRIAERNRIAVQGQKVQFFLFNKRNSGRRCSCFPLETAPDKQCIACFGTGVVGGYDKHGTILEIFDVTHPNIVAVNVWPFYSAAEPKPIKFSLVNGALEGHVQTRIHLKPNVGRLDHLDAFHIDQSGGELWYFVKGPQDLDFLPLTEDAVQQRLGNPWLDFKVNIKRTATQSDSPLFGFIYLRYQVLKQIILDFDVPRTERGSVYTELGLDDNWERQAFWSPPLARKINPGDILISSNGDERWKLYAATEVAPTGYLTSWDLQTRFIQTRSEAIAWIPVGKLGLKDQVNL